VTSLDAPDPELWVDLNRVGSDPTPRWLVAGNAHTHPGRFHVCSVEGDLHREASLTDVMEASPLARMWLDGFLHGQEPDFADFMGADDALIEHADDADYDRWLAHTAQFRLRGEGVVNKMPPADAALSDLGHPAPWCFAAGQFRTWNGVEWATAEPQPDSNASTPAFWPGSVCARLGKHSLVGANNFDYCERCHNISAL
jgi:hypothetical protein